MKKLISIVHLCCVFVGCHLIRTPSNTALMVGQRLELICQPDINYSVREWTSQSPSSTNISKIYAGYSQSRIIGNQRFGFTTYDNSVNLYLNETELDDAGRYDCYVQQVKKQLEHYSAQLIVLEAEPICEDNLTMAPNETLEEGRVVWMRCSVNYRGNMIPKMEWRQHGRKGDQDSHIMTEKVETNANLNVNMSSTLTIVTNSTYNATFFSCKTCFYWDNTSSPDSTATNAPGYSYTWNSSVIIVAETTFVHKETTTASVSMRPSVDTPASDGLPTAFNSIYLVAGVAVVFGIASSLVALILCLRLRRKNSAAMADLDPNEPLPSDYDLIPYACTDGYDTIEEVEEKNDILFTNFPPRLGPLPSPNYSALGPVESKPPGVYSRMEHRKESVDDGKSEVDGVKLHLNSHESTPDYLSPLDKKGIERKSILTPNEYLDLRTSAHEDNVDDSEEIPSDYLKIRDSPVQSTNSTTMEKNIPEDKDRADEDAEMSSTYLTTRDELSGIKLLRNSNENRPTMGDEP